MQRIVSVMRCVRDSGGVEAQSLGQARRQVRSRHSSPAVRLPSMHLIENDASVFIPLVEPIGSAPVVPGMQRQARRLKELWARRNIYRLVPLEITVAPASNKKARLCGIVACKPTSVFKSALFEESGKR